MPGSSVVGDRGGDRLGALGHGRLARRLHASDQIVEGRDELVDPLAQQRVRDVAHVDAGVGQRLQVLGGILVGGGAHELGMLSRRVERGHRHGVDRVRRHQPVHVERVRVLGVLDAGGGPQRALDGTAGFSQPHEALALEDLLEAHVGLPGVGQAGAPLKVRAAQLLEALVDLGVHARHEEAGHGMHVHRLALVEAAFHSADVALGDGHVGLDLEEKRHVDVDALVDRLLDRRQAFIGARDLDHQVGAVDAAPVIARLGKRAVGVVRLRGLHLEGHEAVGTAGLVPHAAQHVGGQLHVLYGQPLEDLARAEVLGRQLAEVVVVVVGAQDRLLEDRRVGGDSAQRVFVDKPLQLALGDQRAPDLVEPDAHAGFGQRRQALVDLCPDAHAVPFSAAPRRLARLRNARPRRSARP